jgi:DNA-binding MurR/RpiR family transcriptional regulator
MDQTTTPRDLTELRARIAEVDLPRRLKDCAAYVLEHGDRIAFDTVADAAQAAGVQPSALIRFAKALGFTGFTEMQRLFRADVVAPRPDYQTRLATLRAHGDDAPEALLADFSAAATASIEQFAAAVDRGALARAAALLDTAPTLHVMGLRRSFAVASHIVYLLRRLDRPAILHDGVGGIDGEPMIGAGHALVAVSFAPYAAETVALAESARARGAFVVAITDPGLSPLRAVGDVAFEVREEEVGGFRSFAATFCLATALCVAVGARRKA